MQIQTPLADEDILYLTAFKEVFGGFAHEIAQPLNALMIASQVIQLKIEGTNLTNDEKAFFIQRLNIVGAQVQKVSQLLESFRTFTRGRQSEYAQPADVDSVFNRIYSLMGQQFASRGIQVALEVSDNLPLILRELQVVEAAIVQGLAFSRDAISAIGQWHDTAGAKYEKYLQIGLVEIDGASGMHLLWNPGQMPPGTMPIDPARHVGLCAAGSILRAAGGTLEWDGGSLRIVFPL